MVVSAIDVSSYRKARDCRTFQIKCTRATLAGGPGGGTNKVSSQSPLGSILTRGGALLGKATTVTSQSLVLMDHLVTSGASCPWGNTGLLLLIKTN